MRVGVDRSEAEYVWPGMILRPWPTRLVYLDLNHWIQLAKAAAGHPHGQRHRPALDLLRQEKEAGRIVCPLSATHYMEMAGITDPRQRADVASVMEELSGFATLLSRAVIMRVEIEALLDAVARPRPEPYSQVLLIGYGSGPAFGVRGGLRIRSEAGDDVTEQVRLDHPGGVEEFDRRIAEAELRLERAVLRGPTDEEVPELKANGWDPTIARRSAEERAQEERAQAARLDASPEWRRGRLRDVIAARYVLREINEMLLEALAARDLKLEDVWHDPPTARTLVDSMPSADVCVSLTRGAHRNPQTNWTANDIFDIDALSLSVPYCDVVATDSHACHLLKAAHVPERVNTTIVASPAELSDAVGSL
jgi:hypothetical protein